MRNKLITIEDQSGGTPLPASTNEDIFAEVSTETPPENKALEFQCQPEEEVRVNSLPLDASLVNLNTYQIQPEVLKLVPEKLARKYNAIPLAITCDTLLVAVADTNNLPMLEALGTWTRIKIELVTAVAEDIQKAIDRNYKGYAEIEKQFPTTPTHTPITIGETTNEIPADGPAVRALELIVAEAVKARASDIHLEPQQDNLRVRYRIDGILHDTMFLPLNSHTPLISRLKILANMNIADHHRPQDGQFSTKVGEKEIDIRVATIETTYGEMVVLRILNKAIGALKLSELGFSPSNLKQYEKMLKSSFGIILVGGPTGSGKTTTLYASINSLDCKTRKIITIEDPIEYRFQNINQVQVNPRAGLTFANGLRSILRLDPNVILVGEIRDFETADIAIRAALTGHIVLSSIHANNAVSVITRLLDLGVAPFLISAAVIGVVNQRMVRKVCPHCGRSSPAPAQSQLAYFEEFGQMRTNFIYGSGCDACGHTGYLGRIASFEILTMTNGLRSLLMKGVSEEQLRAKADEEGFASMWHDGMLKAEAGITTPCEVVRSIFST